MPRLLKFILPALIFLIGFLIPQRTQALCYYPTDPDYPFCLSGIGRGGSVACCVDGPDYCPSTQNPLYACCYNVFHLPETCPPIDPLEPTPTIDPNGDCGHNSEICCPGGICLDPIDTCIAIPRSSPLCLTPAQVGMLPGNPHMPDPIQLFCDDDVTAGVRTSIGCIKASNPGALLIQISSLAIKITGGILLLNIAYAGFLFVTAAGDPERAADSRRLLSSSALGFAVISLAVLILNFFGVDILGLNLFGFNFNI